MDLSYVKNNYDRILDDIRECSAHANLKEPTLICVTKSASQEELSELLSLGVTDIGENRVQMFLDRYESIDKDRTRMHLIGTLQSNKVKYIADKVSLIHSLDRDSLAHEIDRQGEKFGIDIPCLIEINSGREAAKGGIMPENAVSFAHSISELYPHIKLVGAMTMAPALSNDDDYRKCFSLTRELFEEMRPLYATDSPTLSMGMSDSYRIAIECGATAVRIGRALFRH